MARPSSSTRCTRSKASLGERRPYAHSCDVGPPAPRVSTFSTLNTPNPACSRAAKVGAAGSRLGLTAHGSVLPTPTASSASPCSCIRSDPSVARPSSSTHCTRSKASLGERRPYAHSCDVGPPAPRVSTFSTLNTPNPACSRAAKVGAAGSRLGLTARGSVLPTPTALSASSSACTARRGRQGWLDQKGNHKGNRVKHYK